MVQPQVAIVMGSERDWPKIRAAADTLAEFGVAYEAHVMSAHRSPDSVREFARSASERGIAVIIAAAGGAAHLAGTIAAHATLPVIGLPIPTDCLGGMDSLLSIVQMPSDVPVAAMSVGKGGPRNAGLFALQILALGNAELAARLRHHKQQLAHNVHEQDERLQEQTGDTTA
jgi:5-(carboxyamino)imidazole ribonucleotide mutase